MTVKRELTHRALIDALEAIQHELRKLDFYRQAAEDNLDRLHGTFTRAQRPDVERLDHSIQRSRELVNGVRAALEAAVRSVLAHGPRSVRLRTECTAGRSWKPNRRGRVDLSYERTR
jgi:predicted  nucleic acid-binding Zn-ribbon protein